MYRSVRQDVPEGYYNIPIGKACSLMTGSDLTIITYGAPVHKALEIIKKIDTHTFDLIDLRSLCPLDKESIISSVKKTGKAIILQEDSMFGGIASDISALISEHCFEDLDAPVLRCASLDTPVPFAKELI